MHAKGTNKLTRDFVSYSVFVTHFLHFCFKFILVNGQWI